MSQAAEQIAGQFANGSENRRVWGDLAKNVRVSGATGNGNTDDAPFITTAVALASSTGGCIVFPPGTYRIASNFTVPSNVTMWFINGAKLAIDSGVTVTVNGPIEAGLHQIFSGSGTVGGMAKVIAVYPQWFGAKGDGVTDDTAAIQSAKSAAATGGGTLYLPAGTYYVGTSEILFQNYTGIIEGAGRNKTYIHFDNGSQNVLTFQDCNTLTLRNFTMVKKTPDASNTTAIFMKSCNYCTIEGVFVAQTHNGIKIEGGQAGTIQNVDIWYFTSTGLWFNGSLNDWNVRDCFINGESKTSPGSTGTGKGIFLYDKAEALNFSDIEIILCDYCLFTDATANTAGQRAGFSNFTRCFFDSSNSGVRVEKAESIRFNQCSFSNRPNDGIIIDNCFDLSFVQCSFNGNGKNGCVIGTNAVRTLFDGCEMKSNSASSEGYKGLYFASNCQDFTITGCFATNVWWAPQVQTHGIWIDGGCDHYIITNNNLRGNGTAGIQDNAVGADRVVANNLL